eukprot:6500086-Pyramimonas_sp.AAC.1
MDSAPVCHICAPALLADASGDAHRCLQVRPAALCVLQRSTDRGLKPVPVEGRRILLAAAPPNLDKPRAPTRSQSKTYPGKAT